MRPRQGQRVLCKGTGRVAVHIARELVQHNDLRQPPLRRGTPGEQLAPRCGFQRDTKARADGFVLGGVFGEVLLVGQLFEPEVEDGLGLHEKLRAVVNPLSTGQAWGGWDAARCFRLDGWHDNAKGVGKALRLFCRLFESFLQCFGRSG